MDGKFKNTDRGELQYRNRMLACIIAAEIIAIAFFNFWPVSESAKEINQDNFSEDVLAIEDIVRTEQATRPASPPRPQIPIPEPTDEIIEEEIEEIGDLNVVESSDTLSLSMGEEGESDEPVSNPQSPPSVVRIVEPTVPDEAKRENIKAEIWVSFLVDKEGRVEEASISQIMLYDRRSGKAKEVESIGYGLTEATLNAALQWRFNPATEDGEPVKAYSRQIFTFGFSH